ncbi:MAG: hypothetical protein AAB546_00515 [Patescibacteria group bacterium]
MNKLAQVPIGTTFNTPFSTGQNSLGDLISLGLNISFVVAGIIILFMLVFAGFKIIQGAGSGNQQDAQKAQQAASSAVIGFVIIFAAYWIIRLIEIITGVAFITMPGF